MKKKNQKNPFIRWVTGSITVILVGSCSFAMLMFGNDKVFRTTEEQYSKSQDLKLPTTFTQERIQIPKKDNETNLGNVGTSDPGESGDAPITGITGDFQSNGQWYQDLTETMKQGGGSVVATVDIGGVPIGLYSNLPWPASDSAFCFNAPVARKDVVEWLNQGGDSGLDPNRKGVFVYEFNKPTWTTDVEGVTCLGFAPVPSIVDRGYCDGFSTEMWKTQSTPAASLYGYADGSGTPRKYCAILEKDGNTYYLPLVAKDAKGHTFPGGAMQTHMQLVGNNAGSYVLNIGDKGHRSISWSITDIVANLDNPVSGAEPSPLRDYIKVNIEIYHAPSGSLSELNQYDIVGFVSY